MAHTRFDWDPGKDAENQRKHGVSFSRAQYAFADSQRVIAKDVTHSQTEERFYCFGEVDGGVLREIVITNVPVLDGSLYPTRAR